MKQYDKYYRLIFTCASIIIAIFCIYDGFNFYANALNSSALNFGINTNEIEGSKISKVLKIRKIIEARNLEIDTRINFLINKSKENDVDISSILGANLNSTQLVEQLELVLDEKPINYQTSNIPNLCFESIDLATQYATLEINRSNEGSGDLQMYKDRGITIVDYEIESCSYIEDTSMYVKAYELNWVDDSNKKHPIID